MQNTTQKDVDQRLVAIPDNPEIDVDTKVEQLANTVLTERQAEVIIRRYVASQSRQEIADILGTSRSNVDNIRITAEKKLQAAFDAVDAITELEQYD